MTTTNKLLLGVFVLTMVIVANGSYNYWSTQQIDKAVADSSEASEKRAYITDLSMKMVHATLGYMDAIVDKDSGKVTEDIQTNHDYMKTFIATEMGKIDKFFDAQEAAELKEKIKIHNELGEQLIALVNSNKGNQAVQLDDPIDKNHSDADTILTKYRIKAKLDTDYSLDELSRISANSKKMSLMLNLFSGLLVLAGGLYLFANTRKTIVEIVSQLRSENEKLLNKSQELSDTSHTLSQASTEGAASLEETVATLGQVTESLHKNLDLAEEAQSHSKEAIQILDNGKNSIQELQKAISSIEQSAGKIRAMTDLIDDIAFQTNLLSLNAAVEAARAGEHGKGFAVVSEAVRSLAQKSSESAKDINTLVNETNERVKTGSKIAMDSVKLFEKITSSTMIINEKNVNLAQASKAQTEDVRQISLVMNQIDKVTQENSLLAQNTKTMVEELNLIREGLDDVVEVSQKLTVTKAA